MKFFAHVFILISLLSIAGSAQTLDLERGRHITILSQVKSDIKSQYYDPNFRGIDLDARFKTAEQKIKNAQSIGEMSGTIAQVLFEFDDSHLFFIPPQKMNKVKYGFEMQMVGNNCYVSRVHEESDAYKKGLRVGDEILDISRFGPTRKNLIVLNYLFWTLRPQPVIEIGIRKPDGKEMVIQAEAKITKGKHIIDLSSPTGDYYDYIRKGENAYRESRTQFISKFENKLMIWQIPSFSIAPEDIDSIMGQAKNSEALIIDLRDNGGGRVDTLKRLIGHFFDKDIKVGDEKTRKATKEIIAKTRGKEGFTGKLIVLIDAGSGSASEVFSKVIQLEKRGQILGDTSAGAVMESRYFPHQTGMDIVVLFGVSVTVADLIMTDGKSLEKIGVTPDEKILPTAMDLAQSRDIVLSKAVNSLGIAMSPERAGSLFAKEKAKFKVEY